MVEYVPPVALPVAAPMRLSQLSRTGPTRFVLVPDAQALAAFAVLLGVSQLRKLRFEGALTPLGAKGWALQATLGATLVQPCAVSLEPVTTRIDETVTRRYLPDYAAPAGVAAEIPVDVDAEPMPAVVDPAAVMFEALTLAVPPYPRSEGVELGEAVFTEAGRAPLRDADVHPLAGLAALRDRLKG